ncbi:Phage conserved hypothetical protein [uncultured Caudovirales phage]|uniref:Gp6 domain containing protein n=1 Tax=uncultured Caudovirales phage TaxID=2100421 RepID=A0A6J5SH11_9CAUD|nr:Phage conserved hypothetical protein [uncultured Caudovirales phage]CAB4199323.1 Phage conserved hypothetical protein [uncultured Caudovirales phage]CAB4212965.1 Phage conserved hypothetical protein [uncultured Caudovirales phage]CAB5227973.1 Phage conserved hypothetical protein [uncultured Caudovirales phage]
MSFMEPPFWSVHQRQRSLQPARAVVITPPAVDPISLSELKNRLRIPHTSDDADLSLALKAGRRKLEKDLGGARLVPTVVEQGFDALPGSDVLELSQWPLISVESVKTYDLSDTESTFASSNYNLDTASRPGRICLKASASWPTGLRYHRGAIVRYTAGFGGTAKAVTSLTRSGAVVTVATTAAHGYTSGQRITMAGADQADYNGTFEVTVTGAASFTFTVTGTPTTPATGVLTATDLGVPEDYLMALMLLVAHWYENREAVVTGTIATTLPLAYDDLLDELMGVA